MLMLRDQANFNRKIYIDKKKANNLELKLNKSEYGKKWKVIGDLLYDFSIGKNIEIIELTTFQFEKFLKWTGVTQ
tara:strand:- start:786 stop:1010 length:225 start_codon:yes stop_codon:yes gene_type:complete